MTAIGKFAKRYLVPEDQPELLVAQAMALTRHLPAMYLVLMVNAAGLAFTHFTSAPVALTLIGPVLLAFVCTARMIRWWRSREAAMDPARAARMLTGTVGIAPVLTIAFSAWSLALFPYGDAFQKAHVAFFMAITVIACVFCLMHLRAAALLVTTLVVVPMTLFLFYTGEPVLQAIAVNVMVVAAAMIMILLSNFRDFAALVESRRALTKKHAQAQQLVLENDQLANLDSLTLLPNRRRFFHELDQQLERAKADGVGCIVGVIDLDGFKPVNDAFGHATGDRLLVEVGRRLTAYSGVDLFVARLGGDEFGLIIRAPLVPDEIHAVGRELCESLCASYLLPGVTAQVAGSIGFCPFPAGGQTAAQLFERADYALYHAKQHLKGAAVLFDDRHEAEIRELSRVEQALRHADLEREMHVAFQPIVDIVSGRTVAFEALARWTSPQLGDIAPGVFIDAAERSGQIVEITQVLVAKALRSAHEWPMDIGVSINLSARDIASMETVRRLVEIVRDSRIAPRRIDFEITETAIVCDFDQARNALLAFRELGVKTALDDFGTGHSSLSHVRLLPLDKLKIDGSFVRDIENHSASEDIVKTVLELCRNLRIDCIVEGVETQGQRDRVAALGGTVMQGYHFGRPMPAAQVGAYLADRTRAAMARADQGPPVAGGRVEPVRLAKAVGA
jgi:diguanylate cyclase (GGDEF)-like protein